MLVNNKQESIVCFPIDSEKTLQLIPGVNDVREDLRNAALQRCKKQAQRMIDQALIVVEEAQPVSLGDLTQGRAVALVRETLDEKLLKTWKGLETRKGVLSEIGKQLAKVAVTEG